MGHSMQLKVDAGNEYPVQGEKGEEGPADDLGKCPVDLDAAILQRILQRRPLPLHPTRGHVGQPAAPVERVGTPTSLPLQKGQGIKQC